MLYQTEPHSDLGAGLIEEGFQPRKRAICGLLSEALHPPACCAISPASEARPALRPFLLGNGVMVTLRFLVPSF